MSAFKNKIDKDHDEPRDAELCEFLVYSRDLVREIQAAFRARDLIFASHLLSVAADEIDNELRRMGYIQNGSKSDIN